MGKMIKIEWVILTVTLLVLIAGAVFFWMGGGEEGYHLKECIQWTGKTVGSVHTPEGVPQAVNLNTAGPEQLESLPGIGPDLAQSIVAERERSGPFRIHEELIRVKGIGQETLEEILNYITVG